MSPAWLALALCLDALFGEPRWLWSRATHPAVLLGRVVALGDRFLNGRVAPRLFGCLLVALLVILSAGVGVALASLHPIVTILLTAILIAQRSLVQHVQNVADALRISTGDGRRAVAHLVSRDTTQMDTDAVGRAAIESLSENLSDGVIAPAFWALLGGLPGILMYKAVNTADSMIGYRTQRHERFGWAAARLDDVLNWIPARLTALLIAGLNRGLRNWQEITTDAQRHRSPNAGWPEAAMARALNVSLAGPRSYHGREEHFDWVNATGRKQITPGDVDAAVLIVWKVWICCVGLLCTTALVF